MMKIKYTQSRIKSQLGYGVLMIGFGFVCSFFEFSPIISSQWYLLGVLQAGHGLYEMQHQYITIQNNRITKHTIIPRTIEINQINKIRKFVDSYKIETPKRTITIDKGIIETESLSKLTDYLESLQLQEPITS